MEVHFTPEQEAQLSELANHTGSQAADLVKDAALLMLEDAEIRAGVQRGIEQVDRGDLLTHEEVRARMERLFQLR